MAKAGPNSLVIDTNLKEFSKSIRKKSRAVNAWRNSAPRITARCLQEATQETLIKRIKQYIVENKIIFTKTLYNSVQAVTIKQGFKETIVDVQVPGVDYAQGVEQGLSPGTNQDYRKLVKWAQFKLGLDYRGAQRAASNIRRKIYLEGTEEKPFIRVPLSQSKVKLFNVFMSKLKDRLGGWTTQ